MKQQLRTPVWTFSGLGLIGVLVINSVISDYQKDKDNRKLIESPLTEDIYEFKTEDGNYSLLKVSEINGDTIYVFPNKYAATQPSGLTKLLAQGDSTYSSGSYPLLKSELFKMLDEGKIEGIIRD